MNIGDFRVYLRALELDDYKTTIAWRNDDEIWNRLVGRKYFVSSESEKKWISDNLNNTPNSTKLAGCLKEDDEHIAIVYLNNIDHFNKSGGFEILIGNKAYWGEGLGVEFAHLMLHYAFVNLGLERIQARILATNEASIKMHKKAGFKQEGILRKAVFKDGAFTDLINMSILRNEFI